MSGVRNLGNAIANDPGFASQVPADQAAQARQLVVDPRKGSAKSSPKPNKKGS